jgi:uncharacterized membrane protein (DUF106 family)
MGINSAYMKHMYKTLMVSIVALIIFFPWIRMKYGGMAVASLPFNAPFVGSSLDWLFWYLLVSFTIGWVTRKVFGVE